MTRTHCHPPTFLVLGGFLESSWEDAWQRQHEWVRQLQHRGNVLYLERAAAGAIGVSRVLGRIKKMRTQPGARAITQPFPRRPEFVKWTQLPSNGGAAARLSAKRALAAAEKTRVALGWAPISLVHVGTPAEPWIEVASAVNCPVWFDMAERFLYSAAYHDVSRDLMRRQIEDAAVVTTDTEITRSDWQAYSSRIIVVPHGAKSWAAEPDLRLRRQSLVYVGTYHPALDLGLLREVAERTGMEIGLVGEYPSGSLYAGLRVDGWTAGGDMPARLAGAVAGLVPYAGTQWREGIYPSKVYDYWLSGIPAICTRLPALNGLEWAWQCEDAEEMAAAVARAASLDDEARMEIRGYALANTWDVRFEAVATALNRAGVDGFDALDGDAVA